jgi:light-harvesting complex I chlorophyll a/b binding protein 2
MVSKVTMRTRALVSGRAGGVRCTATRRSLPASSRRQQRLPVFVRAEGGEGEKPAEEPVAAAAEGEPVAAPAPAADAAPEAAAEPEAAALAVVTEEPAAPVTKFVDTGKPAEEWRGYKWSEIRRMNKGRDNRPLWYPGGDAPEHLDGSMAGDFGFDPLSLGSDPELLSWFQQAELQHARWAMVGAAGIMVPELMTNAGIINAPLWTEAGAGNYGIPWQGLLATQLFMMGWAEQNRWRNIDNPKEAINGVVYKNLQWKDEGSDLGYPGGDFFDPLRFNNSFQKDPAKQAAFREKEIKNGRLAMVSLVGFATQTFVTGKGPIQCWLDHIADPYHQTLFQNIGH